MRITGKLYSNRGRNRDAGSGIGAGAKPDSDRFRSAKFSSQLLKVLKKRSGIFSIVRPFTGELYFVIQPGQVRLVQTPTPTVTVTTPHIAATHPATRHSATRHPASTPSIGQAEIPGVTPYYTPGTPAPTPTPTAQSRAPPTPTPTSPAPTPTTEAPTSAPSDTGSPSASVTTPWSPF